MKEGDIMLPRGFKIKYVVDNGDHIDVLGTSEETLNIMGYRRTSVVLDKDNQFYHVYKKPGRRAEIRVRTLRFMMETYPHLGLTL